MAIPPQPRHPEPLRDTIARHGLDARKALGQHFLLDPGITARIAGLAGILRASMWSRWDPAPAA